MRCYKIVAEPDNKATMIGIPQVLIHIENGIYRSGQSSLLLLNERLKTLFIRLSFKPFSPFYERLDEIVLELSEKVLVIAERKVKLGEFSLATLFDLTSFTIFGELNY